MQKLNGDTFLEYSLTEMETLVQGDGGLGMALAKVEDVHRYVQETPLPPGYRMVTWGDQSVEVRERLD